MSFAAPLALVLGLLAVPLILLYLLKPRREELTVPSTFLWRQALEEVQANAPWQKLRRNLLLLLQLLVLLLLVVALARPLLRSADAPGGDLVLVLDTSASMAATDVSPSRFDAAADRARALTREVGQGRRIALITAGPSPRLLAGPTTDREAVLKAVANTGGPYGESDLRDATILARSVAGRLADPTIVLIGDGGPIEAKAPAAPYPVRFESVRGNGSNAGILTLATRSGAAGRQLWASIGNYGAARSARLTLSVDGQLFDAKRVDLPANQVTGVEVNDLPAGQMVEAHLDTDDALAADNSAWYIDTQGPPARVLLHGNESPFLERALSLLDGVDVYKSPPGVAVEAGYDVYIFDGDLPAKLPEGNLLLVAPSSSPLLPVTGKVQSLAVTSQKDDSLLLRFVDLSSTTIGRASRISPPDWMEVLASSGDVPVLAAGETDNRKVAALAFSPEQSDLPLQVAFPILVDNLMRYLRPQATSAVDGSVRPGEAVQLTGAAKKAQVVTGPDGRRTRVEGIEDGSPAAFTDTAVPGVYQTRSGDQVVSRFAVNTGIVNESQITATNAAPLTTSGVSPRATAQSGGRERWWPLLLMALAVALVEWWFYNASQVRATGRRRGSA